MVLMPRSDGASIRKLKGKNLPQENKQERPSTALSRNSEGELYKKNTFVNHANGMFFC
jgi:hypothetical protein